MRLRLPRFRLRTLLVLVTLVAVYFGSWPWFKEHAMVDVTKRATRDDAIQKPVFLSPAIPFVIGADVGQRSSRVMPVGYYRRYYLWLFGYIWELPLKTDAMIYDHVDEII